MPKPKPHERKFAGIIVRSDHYFGKHLWLWVDPGSGKVLARSDQAYIEPENAVKYGLKNLEKTFRLLSQEELF